jgi:hypothetical protein
MASRQQSLLGELDPVSPGNTVDWCGLRSIRARRNVLLMDSTLSKSSSSRSAPLRPARAQRGRRAAVAALALALGALTASCGIGGRQVSDAQPDTALVGSFEMGTDDGLPFCEWIEVTGGDRVQVIWPDGWDVRFEPLTLIDDAGQVVATEGDQLRLTGTLGSVGQSSCFDGPIFAANSVAASA